LAGTAVFPPEKLARIRQGIHAIYQMDYAGAAKNFQTMIREAPDDPAGYAYLAMTYWVEELSGKQELSIDRFASSDFFTEAPNYRPTVNPEVERKFREVNQQAIEKAQRRLQSNPRDQETLYVHGLAWQNLASFESALKRNWWPSVRAGAKTFRDHRELLRRDPEFHDARLAIGVYEYVAGSLGWSVKWLAFLLGYHGSKTEGKRQLRLAVEKGTLAADDARLILILIDTREKNYQAAFDHLAELKGKYPRNYLVPLDMGGMALLMKQPGKAVSIYREMLDALDRRPSRYTGLEKPLLYNRMGFALRQEGELAAAAGWFDKSLEESDPAARTATVARLELGKTLDLLGRRGEALNLYQAVLQAGDFAGSRTEAQQLLRRPFKK
jgi:tetratricopeptide (TPR) repeat protein